MQRLPCCQCTTSHYDFRILQFLYAEMYCISAYIPIWNGDRGISDMKQILFFMNMMQQVLNCTANSGVDDNTKTVA